MGGEITGFKSKSLYKATIFALKLLPVTMAFGYFMNSLSTYMGIGVQIITHYLGLVISPLLFILLASYVFKFCEYHRMFIYYIVIDELFLITDWYFKLPISNKGICIIHFIISGIFLFLAVFFYIKKRREDKLKVCNNDKDNKKLIS